MMKEVPGRTSRICQRIGSCPGSRVVPHEPLANGPSSWNCAGGSSQFLMSVRQFHANDGVTSASTECSSWQAMFVMTGRSFLIVNRARCRIRAKVVGPTELIFGKAVDVSLRTWEAPVMKVTPCSSLFVPVVCLAALLHATEIGLAAQAGDPWCVAFQRLHAASNDGFDSVKGRPDPTMSLSWEGSVTFPGLTDCWLDRYQSSGNTIYTCASLLMPESQAVEIYTQAAASLTKCFPRDWTIYRQDASEDRSPSLNAGPDPPELILAISRDRTASAAGSPVPGNHYALEIKLFSRPK
jgi:hypothetical protein